MMPGIGIEVYHDFKASHHASGPVDNYGKDPRIAMDDAVAAGDLTRYNFEQCFDWCVEHMPAPSGGKSHRGTFGANGAYIWEAYTELGRDNPRGFPVIPAGRDFQGLEGSNKDLCLEGDQCVPSATRGAFYCVLLHQLPIRKL
jgi:hypothetical protein